MRGALVSHASGPRRALLSAPVPLAGGREGGDVIWEDNTHDDMATQYRTKYVRMRIGEEST